MGGPNRGNSYVWLKHSVMRPHVMAQTNGDTPVLHGGGWGVRLTTSSVKTFIVDKT